MKVLAALFAFGFALAIGVLIGRRVRRMAHFSRRLSWISAAAGALLAALAMPIEHLVLQWTELDYDVQVSGVGAALLATFLLAAPLEEAAKVLAIWPLYRTHRIESGLSGVGYAAMAAAGFSAVEGAFRTYDAELTGLSLLRASLSAVSHLFCAGAWGYALGAGRIPGRWFPATWFTAVLLHGLFDHIVWGRGPGYLPVALPLLGFMALGAWIALRDPGSEARGSRVPPPTLKQVGHALRALDRPISLGWVLAGVFVTLGVVTTFLVACVVLGRRLGFDFALLDEADMRAAAPLVVLGTAVALAFPIAGYLVARASGTPSVLEPVLATLLALGLMVTGLALSAPAGVLFALAVAPVAVGLACGGAWIGLER